MKFKNCFTSYYWLKHHQIDEQTVLKGQEKEKLIGTTPAKRSEKSSSKNSKVKKSQSLDDLKLLNHSVLTPESHVDRNKNSLESDLNRLTVPSIPNTEEVEREFDMKVECISRTPSLKKETINSEIENDKSESGNQLITEEVQLKEGPRLTNELEELVNLRE